MAEQPKPLDPTAGRRWPVRPGDRFPEMQQVPVPVDAVRECGPVVFRDLRDGDPPYTPAPGPTDPPPVKPVCTGLENLVTGQGTAGVNGDTTLLFDLGRVIKGTFEFQAKVPAGATVTFATGEAKEPLRTYPSTTRPNGDWQTFRPDIGDNRGGRYTGLRFVWVRFENMAEPGEIRLAQGVLRIYPCDNLGSFRCSDPVLNRVWEMCAYSAKLCMESSWPRMGEYLLDEKPHCAVTALIFDRVDRFPWIGDARIIFNAVYHAFGEFDFVRDALDFFVPKAVNPPGAFPRAAACVVDLPPYLLDWILAVLYYVEMTGDRQELADRISTILAVLETWKGPYVPQGFYFFDWDRRIIQHRPGLIEEPIMTEAWPAFVLKYIEAARQSARWCDYFGLREPANQCRRLAEERTRYWLELYPDWTRRFDLHALTNAVLAGLGSPEDHRTIFNRVFADPNYRCTGTPYFGYHILRALTAMNRYPEALEMIRLYWGKMLDLGATTVWEDFELDWTLRPHQHPPQPYGWACNSLCQPAGSGPVEWLSREILGVKPGRPGFESLILQPHPCDLDWAEGTVPTPKGLVRVAWKKGSDGIMKIEHTVPNGMPVVGPGERP